MELQNKVQQILDFFASNPEVSPELRQKFECWLLEHADDASVSEALERMWNRDYPDESLEEIVAAMNRLDKSLDVAPGRRRAPYLSRIAVAACIAAVFALGMLASYFFFKPAQSDREYVLSASADSPGYFTLPDGTTVWLNSGGRLEYSGELDGNIRSVALFGEGYFEVAKNPRRPFHVAMDGLNIEVLGTCFDARCYPDLDIEDVVLRSGSVKVGDAQGQTQTLRPGEKLDYDRADGRMTVESVNAERYCTWMKPRLVFSNVPLSDVMGTLERRFNVDVTMDSIVASKRVTITVKNETSDEIFDILCGITKTSYTVDGRNVTFRARR